MDSCLGLIVSIFPLLVFAFFFLVIISSRKKSFYKQFNTFIARFGSVLPEPSRFGFSLPYLDTTYDRRPLRISLRQTGGKHKTTYSRFEMNVHTIALEFVITQQDFLSNIGKHLGMQ